MQSKEINSTLSRSFPEIWATLGRAQRGYLYDVMRPKTGVTYQTLWNWGEGKSRPTQRPTREAAAKVISKFIGQDMSADQLFPF